MSSKLRSLTSPLLALTALTVLAMLLGAAAPSSNATPAVTADVDFATEVWPLLERSCLQCHDSGTAFSNLRIDSPEKILEGGDLGKVVVPGEPDNSPLVTRLALPMDDLDFMPIEGDPMTEEEIELMRSWIAQGADFGDWTGPE